MAEEVDFLGNLGVRTGDKLLFEGDGQGVSAASSKQKHFPNFATLATPESRWAERALTNGCAGYVDVAMTTAFDTTVVVALWNKDPGTQPGGAGGLSRQHSIVIICSPRTVSLQTSCRVGDGF